MQFVAKKSSMWVPVGAVAAGFVVAIGAALAGVSVPQSLVVVAILLGVLGLGAWGLAEDFRRGRKLQMRRKEIAAQKEREQAAAKAKRERVEKLGAENSALVESVQAAVDQVVASEAARGGWLGDVDFTADVAGITESLRKAHELRKVALQLSSMDEPTADDRKMLDEARSAVAVLKQEAAERIALIQRCAKEAKLVDESLRQERKDAQNADKKAELHAKLSGLLYGIESAPSSSSGSSSADAVIARVQAYREIKSQVQLFRSDS